jgi:hypothetical protein
MKAMQKAYDLVQFIGYTKHVYTKEMRFMNTYVYGKNYISFKFKNFIVFKLNDIEKKISSTVKTHDYKDFLSVLTLLHPQKMREWKIKNIILK